MQLEYEPDRSQLTSAHERLLVILLLRMWFSVHILGRDQAEYHFFKIRNFVEV
jgi:hypothetical protein